MKRELRRAAILGLSAGLVLTSLAGCSRKNGVDMEKAVITVNGDEIAAGVLNFAVRYDQAGLEGAYTSFGITDPFNQDLFGAGQTLGEMAKEQEAEQLTHALLAEQKMEDYGVTITDEEKADITAAATAFIEANDAETLEKIGVTQEYVERYLELHVVQHKMEPEMSADVDTEVSDEEAAQRRVQYVFFAPVREDEAETETEVGDELTPAETEANEELTPAETEQVTEEQTEGETVPGEASLTKEESVLTTAADEAESETEAEAESDLTPAETEQETETETEDPETAEAMAKALAQAEEFLSKVQAGEDFSTAAEDLGKNMTETTMDADYYVPELAEATEGLADGTLVETPIKTDSGYYVIKLISQLDREATDAEKENIVAQRKADRISELYTEWEEAGEVSQDAEILSQIVYDYSLMTPTEAETEAETDLTPAEEAATEAELTPAETEAVTEAEITPAEAETEA